jgi:hypothetical protein
MFLAPPHEVELDPSRQFQLLPAQAPLGPEEVGTSLARLISSVPETVPDGAGSSSHTSEPGPGEVSPVGPTQVREIMRWRPTRSPTPRAGWPRRTSAREWAARSTRAPPGNSRRRQPGFQATSSSFQGRHEPGQLESSKVAAVRLAPDRRTLSAAAARAVGGRGRAARQAPAAPASRPGRRGPPRGDRPNQDRPARTGRLEPGPDRRPRPPGDDRTAPDALRGRATDRADRTVSGGTGADGQLRPARRSARRATGPSARSAGHGAENERGSARRCPPDTARGAQRSACPRQSGGSARSPWPAAVDSPDAPRPGAQCPATAPARLAHSPAYMFSSSVMNGFAEAGIDVIRQAEW